jgi:hypothetical protein
MDVSKLAEEILAVVRSGYKAAKAQKGAFSWNMTELKARIEYVLRRTMQKGEEGGARRDSD